MTRFVFTLEEAFDLGAEIVGGKSWGLARLARYGFTIPKTLALGTELYREILKQPLVAASLKRLQCNPDDPLLIDELHRAILAADIPVAFIQELDSNLREAGLKGANLAVRSSAVGEDGVAASFAGQHRSVLSVTGSEELLSAVRECLASLWTAGAVAYRLHMGFDLTGVSMGITLCEMVEGAAEMRSGVAFTADPVSGRRDIMVVEAVEGLADDLVSGQVQGCRYEIPRDQVATAQAKEGPLSDSQLVLLGQELVRLHWSLGDGDIPYDTEWLFDGTRIVFVQARPVTAMPHCTFPEVSNAPIIWSNANLKEVLAEIPCPISWGFIETGIPELMHVLPRTAGYPIPAGIRPIKRIKGRCYGDLSGLQWLWYDGFGQNPGDSNRSIGGHQPVITIPEKTNWLVRLRRLGRGLKVMKLMKGVEAKLEQSCAAIFSDVRAFRATDLAALDDRELVEEMWRWLSVTRSFMPDFAKGANSCGIKLFLFEQQVGKLRNDTDRKIAHALLSGGGQMDSAEHAVSLRHIAELAREDKEALRILEGEGLPVKRGEGAFETALRHYLDQYGHRGVGELDMVYPRWSEDPRFLFEQIRFLMTQESRTVEQASVNTDLDRLLERLPGRHRKALLRAAEAARGGMALRERVKSAIVAAMEPVRRLLLEKGRRMVRDGQLQQADDLCWITFQEFMALLAGRWNGKGLKQLVCDRRARHAAWAGESVSDVYIEEQGQARALEITENLTGAELVGFGAFPGRYQGTARVLRSPDDGGRMMQGDIMVAPFTDPSWTPLFLRAGALVMEIGGTMSHGVIVARELGLPTVVNIPGALQRIADGEFLEVDGSLGRVLKKV
ncbi:PEP-utilizing enzyme [Kiloniella laminariae]|uniref:PEP-utilizing enzyme n=1 Tax=Kiloniella laminariae TaxID=454162 RepID=A0ABT4LMR3_9PROT|nr:PEP/pyruvate-binding domain-containing protein [Kiloniella laminariae]MCZ4282412.1 PEP-utilizing enzyme [Kiloniella laminariae]